MSQSSTRGPAMIDAFGAEIMENKAPPTMTMPPTGPRKCRAFDFTRRCRDRRETEKRNEYHVRRSGNSEEIGAESIDDLRGADTSQPARDGPDQQQNLGGRHHDLKVSSFLGCFDIEQRERHARCHVAGARAPLADRPAGRINAQGISGHFVKQG